MEGERRRKNKKREKQRKKTKGLEGKVWCWKACTSGDRRRRILKVDKAKKEGRGGGGGRDKARSVRGERERGGEGWKRVEERAREERWAIG